MKNYQAIHYQQYYVQDQNGAYIPTTHDICFAPPEEPTTANPCKQRWFYDPEAGYAVRLARTPENELISKFNHANLKAEERHSAHQAQCFGRRLHLCDQDCGHCTYKQPFTVELDKPLYTDDSGIPVMMDFEDLSADIEKNLEHTDELTALRSAITRLDAEDRQLLSFMYNKVRKQTVAERLGITVDGVYHREQQLKNRLRNDPALKFFR